MIAEMPVFNSAIRIAFLGFIFLCAQAAIGQVRSHLDSASRTEVDELNKNELQQVVVSAFQESHDGWSSDEVLVNSELNAKFLKACENLLPENAGVSAADLNWTMLNLRKAKKLGGNVTKRKRSRHRDYRHAAEIAARSVEDKHRKNIDRIMCDPALRVEFDRLAKQLAPEDVPLDSLRRAAIGLRKAKRLQPEYVVRVADWGRQIEKFAMSDLVAGDKDVPDLPGVYLFYDNSGYLYIGESQSLRERLSKHIEKSDRLSLAKYFEEQGTKIEDVTVEVHSFDQKSSARLAPMRRAYESELIRSRNPRFNIRP